MTGIFFLCWVISKMDCFKRCLPVLCSCSEVMARCTAVEECRSRRYKLGATKHLSYKLGAVSVGEIAGISEHCYMH